MDRNLSIKRIAYFRKSSDTEDRQVLSIPAQTDELNKLSHTENFTFDKVFSESHSAKKPGRPVFNEMLDYVESGAANAIVTWAPNRLSRNSIDTGRIIYLMDLGKLIEVRTPSQVFKNNPNDKFLLNLFCSQAKLENDNKGEDVKRGLHAKVKQGWFPGAAPIGYLNTPDKEKGYKIIIKDAERFPLVRKLWDMALSGKYTVRQMHILAKNELNLTTVKRKKIGGKALSMSGIYRVLTDSFYYGDFEFPTKSNIYYEGKHEPMITPGEFSRVQLRLGSKGKPRSFKRRFAYTGPIFCGECNSQITAEEKHQIICSSCKTKFSCVIRQNCPKCGEDIIKMDNPTILHYVYYHCTKQKSGVKCSQRSVEVNEFEKQLLNYLKRITINKQYLEWAVKFLKEDNAFEAQTNQVIAKNREMESQKISGQLEALLELRINGEIDADEFLFKKNALTAKKRELEELMQNAHYNRVENIEKSIHFFDYCFSAVKKFEEAKANSDYVTLKELLVSLGSNLTLKDKKLFISLLKPFEMVEGGLKNTPPEKAPFEPENPLVKQGQNDSFIPFRNAWLPVVEAVRTYYFTEENSETLNVYKHFRISGES